MLNYLTSEAALAVSLGSIFQEVLHWYGLRQKFHLKTTRRLLASPLYWVMTILMMCVSVCGVYFWFDAQVDDQSLRDLFVFGAAFPMIFKSLVKAATARQHVELGGAEPVNERAPTATKGVLGSYFGA